MILVINRRRKEANSVSEILYYMGILSRAIVPSEAANEISTSYRAVIIMDPQMLPDPKDYVERLRSYAKIPVFAVSDNISEFSQKEIFDGTFRFSIFSITLINGIISYCRSNELPIIGDYRVAGINANADHKSVKCFDDVLDLTKTETMILRFLIRSYPLPVDSRRILKYSFKITKLPEASSVRTHICMINKKFRKISGRKLITMIEGKGYVIETPEIRKTYSL